VATSIPVKNDADEERRISTLMYQIMEVEPVLVIDVAKFPGLILASTFNLPSDRLVHITPLPTFITTPFSTDLALYKHKPKHKPSHVDRWKRLFKRRVRAILQLVRDWWLDLESDWKDIIGMAQRFWLEVKSYFLLSSTVRMVFLKSLENLH